MGFLPVPPKFFVIFLLARARIRCVYRSMQLLLILINVRYVAPQNEADLHEPNYQGSFIPCKLRRSESWYVLNCSSAQNRFGEKKTMLAYLRLRRPSKPPLCCPIIVDLCLLLERFSDPDHLLDCWHCGQYYLPLCQPS